MSKTHGQYRHPMYRSWIAMKSRCLNPKHVHHDRYGGRGIAICQQWQAFRQFYEDMGATWFDGATLDRIDTDGDYTPSNTRWATHKEQANNRRNTRYLELDGERLPLSVWADRVGITQNALRQRMRKGWSLRDTLSTGPEGPGRRPLWVETERQSRRG